MVKKPMIYSPFAVDRDVLDHLPTLGREVLQQLRPFAHFGRKRAIFIVFGLAGVIAFDGVVCFKVIAEVSFVDRPSRFLDCRTLLGNAFFHLARKVLNSLTNAPLSLNMIVLRNVPSLAKRNKPWLRSSAKPCVTLVQIIFNRRRVASESSSAAIPSPAILKTILS
jgi:hypothetical protein